MVGSKFVFVTYRKFIYNITLKHKISILRGNSATGKTALHEAIAAYGRKGKASGVKLEGSCPCIALSGDWRIDKHAIAANDDSILVIDEDNDYIFSNVFASMVKASSNYFLIITRDDIPNLPYGMDSIYHMETTKVGNIYNTTNVSHYPLNTFGNSDVNSIITEDAKSVRHFIGNVTPLPVICCNASGNSNLSSNCKTAFSLKSRPIVLIDSSASIAFAEELYKYAESGEIFLWAPHSFEWMLLKSGIVQRRDTDRILEYPENMIYTEKFTSWERFFMWSVTEAMSKCPGREYSKSNISPWYYSEENRKKFLSVVPEVLKKYFN